ncbi:MAG TPA: hypothetical protein VI011_21035 [Asanoa sp.]|jgi:hypothetical protein
MTPPVAPSMLEFLGHGDPASSRTAGVVLLVTVLVALVVRVVWQSGEPFPSRDGLRLLDLVAAPLLLVFVLIVVERFRDLS